MIVLKNLMHCKTFSGTFLHKRRALCHSAGLNGKLKAQRSGMLLSLLLLPLRLPQQCTCSPSQLKLICGKEVILVGRYQLNLPTLSCSQYMKSWTTGLELVHCGNWPATINRQTILHVDLFQSFQDLKELDPGLSRQAFIGMLDERTKSFGRVSVHHISLL